jgi:UDP-N-acetylmuramoyl-tripeptide--D-alanyl-D-alanine ligase
MKSKKLLMLEKILRLAAVAVLKRHKPKIVAITGSMGKTSTKEAVFAVLSSKFDVRKSEKNYNNEIGIPLVIIGAESGGKNIFKWAWVFLKWLYDLVTPFYPEILVFELGVDRPGDMKYFMSFIKPDVGIVTNVSLSHVEFFKTIENTAREKRILIESLGADGVAILNMDDELVLEMKKHTKAEVMTFGTDTEAVVNASNIIYNLENGKPEGISFKLNYEGKNMPIRMRNFFALHYVYAALAAISTGIVFKINLVDIAKSLETLKPAAGRLNLLEGINGSGIIDDTYNASPASTISALEVLAALPGKRKIAVLGDMLELGNETENGHREVAKRILDLKIDNFIAVGKRMEHAAGFLISSGFPVSAAEKVFRIIQKGDLVLVKGSQGMRMEKIVEKLIVDGSKAHELLCRQNSEWKKKEFANP